MTSLPQPLHRTFSGKLVPNSSNISSQWFLTAVKSFDSTETGWRSLFPCLLVSTFRTHPSPFVGNVEVQLKNIGNKEFVGSSPWFGFPTPTTFYFLYFCSKFFQHINLNIYLRNDRESKPSSSFLLHWRWTSYIHNISGRPTQRIHHVLRSLYCRVRNNPSCGPFFYSVCILFFLLLRRSYYRILLTWVAIHYE